ncbi:glutathione S-transferase A-like isoform X1 [Denticeps clupeoides]|uniref:Glutathione S-transferase n=1 Tax=Denticeps clupeoides TaxID=299321 RepID=A0AAY4D5N7_9TELE|nr:glutathione S-transferase A-like isoform X1 [Denticeps clupeoides]
MAEDMFLFWGSGSPPCWRAMIALEEKGLQGYKNKLLSFEKGEHKQPEVLEVNPRGQLPAFRHGEKKVNESLAICMYLESQFKSRGTQLIPDKAADQALVYQRAFEGLVLQQKLVDLLMYARHVPEEERQETTMKRNMEAASAEAQLWEGHVQEGSCLAGKDFTMADVVVYPVVALMFRLGLSTEKYPKLSQYNDFLKDRPSIKATYPPHWLESPPTSDLLKSL